MEKSVILVIRSHGEIPITWKNNSAVKKRVGNIVQLINPKVYCNKFNILSLSQLGGVCYGEANQVLWVNIIKTNYKKELEQMNQDSLINFLFINPDEDVKILNSETFGEGAIPEYTEDLDFTVNKVYTIDRNFKSSIEILQSKDLNRGEERKLNEILEKLNTELNNYGKIERGQILQYIFNGIGKINLTLCDLSCDAFTTTEQSELQGENFKEMQANWIIKSLKNKRRPIPKPGIEVWTQGIRGGKKSKKKIKKKNKKKTKKK